MMLGRENPMVYTPEEIFNPTVANMVLLSMGTYANALREDYKDAQNKEEQFMKEYGSFISPIAKDQEYYYNNTLGGLGKMFEEADRQGVDLLRSQQGRALIQRYIMSRPYAQLANMRQSATNALEYIKNRDDLKAKGLYSDEMERWANPVGIDQWNTINNGVWTNTSPNQYKTQQMMLKDMIDELQNNPKFLRQNGYYRYFGSSDDRIKNEINSRFEDLLAQPSMQYMLSTVGGDKDALKNQLFNVARNLIGEKEEKDEVGLALANMDLQRELATIKHNKNNRSGNGSGNLSGEDTQLSTDVERRTQDAKSNIQPRAFYDYFVNMAAKQKNPTLKKKYQGYADEWKNYMTATKDDLEKFLKKYGYIDDNKQPTDKFRQWDARVQSPFKGKNRVSTVDLINNSWNYYQSYQTGVTGPIESETLQQAVSGTDKRQKNGFYKATFGNGTDYARTRAIDFGGNYDNSWLPKRGISHAFAKWLKDNRISGNLYDTNGMTVGKLPGNVMEISNIGVTVKADVIDKFIKHAKRNNYIMSNGKHAKDVDDSAILADLGLTICLADGTPTTYRVSTNAKGQESKSESGKRDNVYIKIPTSHSINATSSNLYSLNTAYNKNQFGGSKAYDEALNALIESYKFSQ